MEPSRDVRTQIRLRALSGRRVPALLLCAAACSTPPDASVETETTTEEAGVEVVSNPGPGAWSPGDAWTVEEILTIRGSQTDARYQFGAIAGLDVDSEGNIFVADELAQELRVFDASGAYVDTIGRAGRGPGELGRKLAGVFLTDDEILVPDLSNRRISSFGLDGVFRSSERIDLGPATPVRTDVLPGVGLVVQRRLTVPGDSTPPADAIVALANQARDTITVLEPGQSVQVTGGLPKIRQFAPEPIWDSSHDGRLVTASTSVWRFKMRGPDGSLQRVIARTFDRMAVRERDRRAVLDDLQAMYEAQGVPNALIGGVINRMEFEDTFPAFTALALGPAGSLWVQNLISRDELTARGATIAIERMGSRTWSVFEEDGRYLGDVTFPTDFRPIRLVDHQFYGVARDAFDVETVAVYRVVTDD